MPHRSRNLHDMDSGLRRNDVLSLMRDDITIKILLNAYASGYFPMAESRDAKELMWFSPELRGVIPLDGFHVPAKLEKLVKKNTFIVTRDKAFPDIIRACAERGEDTWINEEIITLYCELARMGFAHSVECWDYSSPSRGEDGRGAQSGTDAKLSPHLSPPPNGEGTLVGGLYGVALGGAFFGESMFSRVPNASKIALVHLVQTLKSRGYALLDTQYVNEHLLQFGVIEIPREEYLQKLEVALHIKPEAF